MVVDTGLQRGAAYLREQKYLLDFTLKVQDRELRVHKFVLASVSDYFRAMICGPTGMSESMKDMVELKGLKAEDVSKLIDYIYTGDSYYINMHPKEMLELAVYFQMPEMIQKCKNNLSAILSVENCVDLLSTFNTYSFDKEIDKVSHFIKIRTTEVMLHCKVEDITPDVVQIILDCWKKSEWDMFQFLRSWIGADFDNRDMYMNDFMSHVRFWIMPPQQIKEVRQMDGFKEAEGSWKDLVEKALVYHEQPILQQVTHDSDQNQFRFGKTVFIFNINRGKNATKLQVLAKDSNQTITGRWKTGKTFDYPQVTGRIPFVLEVNNFLITCSEFGKNQTWQIFDPRTLTWTKMRNMPKPKDAFAMVYHNKLLYVLGGTRGTWWSSSKKCLTDTIDKYNFEADSWSSTKKLPVAVKNHSACVLNDAIYVSGGEITEGTGLSQTARMDCLDIASYKWERKAPMHKEMANHKMSVVTVKMEEAIVVIDEDLMVRYYNTSSDQWSSCNSYALGKFTDAFHDVHCRYRESNMWISCSSENMMLVDGDTVYVLHVPGNHRSGWDRSGGRSASVYSVQLKVPDEDLEKFGAQHTSAELGISTSISRAYSFSTFDLSQWGLPDSELLNVVGGVLHFQQMPCCRKILIEQMKTDVCHYAAFS